MRIKKIELSGFRGFSRLTTIDLRGAFTVVCGRNGTGKSTICDAIEYALSGVLERFGESSENRETIDNYLWWRKSALVGDRHVRIVFEDSNGEFDVLRTADGAVRGLDTNRFFVRGREPDSPWMQLCRGSIIRDETITRYSTDQSEQERGDFVDKSLGVHDLSGLIRNAQQLVAEAKSEVAATTETYQRISSVVSKINSQIAELGATAARSADTLSVEQLRREMSDLVDFGSSSEVVNVLSALRKGLAQERANIDTAERLAAVVEEIAQKKQDVSSNEALARQAQLQANLERAKQLRTTSLFDLSEVDRQIKTIEETSPRQAALAALREHGQRLGLERGHCPLCGSEVSPSQFEAHLQAITDELKGATAQLKTLVTNEAALRQRITEVDRSIASLEKELSSLSSGTEIIASRERDLETRANRLGVAPTKEGVAQFIVLTRQRVQRLQTALNRVESSEALERIAVLERERQVTQDELNTTEGQLKTLEGAQALADDVSRTLRRLNGEIIRERLTSISPLFLELYSRLRPHRDFLKIRYLVRGDVQHLLSLLVESDINPRFVFSTGQKRVLGLAFLLSVYLSRSWSNLNCVILDDPVQHIDDYRALHMVEVLSAINMRGHQILCMVEDPDLADLICRRLGNSSLGEGTRIDLEYEPGAGTAISRVQTSVSMPRRVLLSA